MTTERCKSCLSDRDQSDAIPTPHVVMTADDFTIVRFVGLQPAAPLHLGEIDDSFWEFLP